MIPRELERLILKGQAEYRVLNHAFGMFGSLPMPDNRVGIIINITWWPFLNPINTLEGLNAMTYNQFFKYLEYQLTIDAKKSTNFLQFRNAIDWKFTDPSIAINLDDIVDFALINKSFYAGVQRPVQHSTYIVCEEYIKLTISRNPFLYKTVNTMGSVNQEANEEFPPTSINGQPVLLNLNMNDADGDVMNYQPPTPKYTSIAPGGRTHSNYSLDIGKLGIVNRNSILSPVQDIQHNLNEIPLSPFLTHPLINFGVVFINRAIFDQLQNT